MRPRHRQMLAAELELIRKRLVEIAQDLPDESPYDMIGMALRSHADAKPDAETMPGLSYIIDEMIPKT